MSTYWLNPQRNDHEAERVIMPERAADLILGAADLAVTKDHTTAILQTEAMIKDLEGLLRELKNN